MDPGMVAVGTWSGGRFMRFGEAISQERMVDLLRPAAPLSTVITADVYGMGAADSLLGEALAGTPRDQVCVVGAIGHDFYEGERNGPKGFPRFTDPALRGPSEYAGYLRMATERSLERCGIESFDVLLLHNPDRIGYESEIVWDAMAALRESGLTRTIGVAPGPANGFTLDVIGCFERFGTQIDWAMLILNPLEPWPGELALAAARAAGVRVIARVVDYGGLFWGDIAPGHEFPREDHRAFRPAGWVEDGLAKIEQMRPIAQRHRLTLMQLACQWVLAQPAVCCVAPTLVQEPGNGARTIESKRAELETLPAEPAITKEEIAQIRAIGENAGCMALKGAVPDHSGADLPDRWRIAPAQFELAARWDIDPEVDLRRRTAAL